MTPFERWILGTFGAVVALVAVAGLIFWLWEPRLEQWGLIVLVGVIAYLWGECVGTCRANVLEDERERKYGPWLRLTDPVANEKGFVQQTDLGSGAVIESSPKELSFADALKMGGAARVTLQDVEIPFIWREEALNWLTRVQRRPVTEAQVHHVADLQRQRLETRQTAGICARNDL